MTRERDSYVYRQEFYNPAKARSPPEAYPLQGSLKMSLYSELFRAMRHQYKPHTFDRVVMEVLSAVQSNSRLGVHVRIYEK